GDVRAPGPGSRGRRGDPANSPLATVSVVSLVAILDTRRAGRLTWVPMREDCLHYESRTYDDDGEVARFCTLDLAPEAPWRCPDACPRYERILMIASDFEQGSLAHQPPVDDEPDGPVGGIVGVLAAAEAIVADAVPEVVAAIER